MEWIYGDRIKLRLMTREDTEKIVTWRNNPRVRFHFIYQELFTTKGHEKWFDTMIETGKAVQFIICEKDTDRPIGSVYFRDINETHKKAEYGIFIGEDDAVGKGLGTEVCKLACRYGFETYGWNKIMLRAFADNTQAIKSYENAGFRKEAVLKEDVCIDGIFRDIVFMALFAGDVIKDEDAECKDL